MIVLIFKKSSPAHRWRDKRQYGLDDMRVICHSELVRYGEQQCVGLGDGLVRPEFLNEPVGLGRNRADTPLISDQSIASTSNSREPFRRSICHLHFMPPISGSIRPEQLPSLLNSATYKS